MAVLQCSSAPCCPCTFHLKTLSDPSYGLRMVWSGSAPVLMCALLSKRLALALVHTPGDLPYQLRMVCSGALETVQRLSVGKDWGETNPSAQMVCNALLKRWQIQEQDACKTLLVSRDLHLASTQGCACVPLPAFSAQRAFRALVTRDCMYRQYASKVLKLTGYWPHEWMPVAFVRDRQKHTSISGAPFRLVLVWRCQQCSCERNVCALWHEMGSSSLDSLYARAMIPFRDVRPAA
eukprot:966927-Pelagomonas_calceolata.AAC.5